MAKALRFFGLAWCNLVAVIILLSLALMAYNEGLGRVQEIMSPFNIANYIVMIAALSPGLLCLWGADKLRARAADAEQRTSTSRVIRAASGR